MKIGFLTKINYKENYPLMALITQMKNAKISVSDELINTFVSCILRLT